MPGMSEARKRANKKWNDENLPIRYDHIHLTLPAGYKNKIKNAADQAGEKVNEYIRNAVDMRIDGSDDEGRE